MLVKVTVFPDFKKELIEKLSETEYKMYIRQAAQRGEANKRVLNILRSEFPERKVFMRTGSQSTKKIFEIC